MRATSSAPSGLPCAFSESVKFGEGYPMCDRTMTSDIRIKSYKEIGGFDVPTEFLVIRNGRPFWREEYADVRINAEFPPGTFDQATWHDIPIPKQ